MTANFFLYHLVLLQIYFILSLSLNLINGHCGLFSLGHAGFMAVGAYASALFVNLVHLHAPELFAACPFGFMVLSFVIGFIFAGLAGLLIGLPCVRLRGDYLAIATLAFGEIIHKLIISSETLGGTRGYEVAPVILVKQSRRVMTVLGIEMQKKLFYNISFTLLSIAAVIFTFILIKRLMASSHGRAIVSIREDEKAADILGIDTVKYKLLAFFLGSGLAGMAGGLYAHFMRLIGPADFDLMKTVTILLMVVLGGMGSRYGILVATFILYAIPEILRANLIGFWAESAGLSAGLTEWLTKLSAGMTQSFQLIYAFLLILLMVLRPQGLFGKPGVSREILKPRMRFWQRLRHKG